MTEASYKEKAQCIIGQCGNFEAWQVGLKLNGINKNEENVFDNSRLKEACKANTKLFIYVPVSFLFKVSKFYLLVDKIISKSHLITLPFSFHHERSTDPGNQFDLWLV